MFGKRKKRLWSGDPCPLCGKPLMVLPDRSTILGRWFSFAWLVCSDGPRCAYAKWRKIRLP